MSTLVILAVVISTLAGLPSETHSSIPGGVAGERIQARASLSDSGRNLEEKPMYFREKTPHLRQRKAQEKAIKRRSINLPDPDKPKVNRLLKVNRNRFLEVSENGSVVTSTASNSIYSKLEVQFTCQVYPNHFRPCSQSMRSQAKNEKSVYSSVLLRFTATNRYLCMDSAANIYTKPDTESRDVSECIFQHDFLPNQYDVYYSQKYPQNSTRCISRKGGGGGDSNQPQQQHHRQQRKSKYCEMRWFIGVNRKSEVATIKSARSPNHKTYFIQRWVHEQPTQTSPLFKVNPFKEAMERRASGSLEGTATSPIRNSFTVRPKVPVSPDQGDESPVSKFLTQWSIQTSLRIRGPSRTSGCGNLLQSCDDRELRRSRSLRSRPGKRRKQKRKST